MTEIYAHRGNRAYFPENTLPAFQSAIDLKVDGIELDIHLTKDNQLVVIHDEKIDRTTNGKGFVKDYTLSELKKLDAGSWFNEQFIGVTIPTLEEVIELLNKNNFTGMLNIEVKTDHIEYYGIEAAVVELLHTSKRTFNYMYSSFNFDTIERLNFLDSQAEKAYILGTSDKKVNFAVNHQKISTIHPKVDWVLTNLTKIDNHFPLKIRSWTVNDENQMRILFRHKIAGFFTDYPKLALEIRKEMEDKNCD